METLVLHLATSIALCLEGSAALLIAAGAAHTIYRTVRRILRGGEALATAVRRIWLGFAGWMMLGLEFTLAADIVRTATSPTWTLIGQLGAIAFVRTAMGYVLTRDMRQLGRTIAQEDATAKASSGKSL